MDQQQSRRINLLLSCCFVFSIVCSMISSVDAQATAVAYISPTGNDLNSGTTASQPMKTLLRVKTYFQNLNTPNLIINCANGIYPPAATVGFTFGNITLQATTPPDQPNTWPVIFNQSVPFLSMSSSGTLTLGPGLSIVGGKGTNGGLIQSSSQIIASGVQFSQGSSTGLAGGVYLFNTPQASSFTQCQFIGNTAATQGGAVALSNADASFVGCSFFTNTAQSGGAVSVTNTANPPARDYVVEFINTLFQNNAPTTGSGGALNVAQPGQQLQIVSCVFLDNPSAVYVGSGVIFTAVESSFNRSDSSAVQTKSNQLSLTNCHFGDNPVYGLYVTGVPGAADTTTINDCTFSNNAIGLNLLSLQSQATVTGLTALDSAVINECTVSLQSSRFSAGSLLMFILPASPASSTITNCHFSASLTSISPLVTLSSADPTADVASLGSVSVSNCSFAAMNATITTPAIFSVQSGTLSVSLSSFDLNDTPLLEGLGDTVSTIESSTFDSYTSIELANSSTLTFTSLLQFTPVEFELSNSAQLTYLAPNNSALFGVTLADTASASLGLTSVSPNVQNTLKLSFLFLEDYATLVCSSNDTAYVSQLLVWTGGLIKGPGTTTTVQIPRTGRGVLTNDAPKSLVWNTLTNYGQTTFRHNYANNTVAIDLVSAPGAITNFGIMAFDEGVAITGGYCSIWNDGEMIIQAAGNSMLILGSETEFTMTRRATLTYKGPWQTTPFLYSEGQVSVNGTLHMDVSSDSDSLVAWKAIEFNSSSCINGPCKFQGTAGTLLHNKGAAATFRPSLTYSPGLITVVETDVKKNLGGGAIAGIVLGSIAGSLLLVAGSYFVWIKFFSPRRGDDGGLYNPINEPGAW